MLCGLVKTLIIGSTKCSRTHIEVGISPTLCDVSEILFAPPAVEHIQAGDSRLLLSLEGFIAVHETEINSSLNLCSNHQDLLGL